MSIKSYDYGVRPIITVQPIPQGLDWVEASFTLAAGAFATVNILTVPPAGVISQRLTLWDFLYSVRIDVNNNDHRFSNGASLTAAQRNLRMFGWVDFIESSDRQNIRTVKIRFENFDSSSHDYYLLFKGYTFAANAAAGIT